MTLQTLGHITLPDHFAGLPEERRAIHRIVAARFPMEIDLHWQFDRRPFQAVIREVPQCPTVVPFADVRDRIEGCDRGEIYIGLDRHRNDYKSSFMLDDPHWGFEVGSRRGKSTFASLSIAQLLHQDSEADATCIDVKVESFKALFGVPRVRIVNDPGNIPAMWDAIREFREDMDARRDARAKDRSLDFPFSTLWIDEVTQFSMQTDMLWRKIKSRKDPSWAPCWEDIAASMWQGAAFRKHVVLLGQRVDHRITGGIGLIGCLGFKGLAGYWPANWDRLFGTRPQQRSRPERGRWIYSQGGDETWVQNVWATDEEIKDYAMSPGGSEQNVVTPSDRRRSFPSVGLTLRQAHDAGIITGSLAAIQRASNRPGFPTPIPDLLEGNARCYSHDTLVAWETQRTTNRKQEATT
jgi:hypothetical protein